MGSTISVPEDHLVRLTRGELREHLLRSGDTRPDETIRQVQLKAQAHERYHCAGGQVEWNFDGWYWVKTRIVRVAL
jgi:hypothetical protein